MNYVTKWNVTKLLFVKHHSYLRLNSFRNDDLIGVWQATAGCNTACFVDNSTRVDNWFDEEEKALMRRVI